MNTKELLDHRTMMIAVKKGVVPRGEFRQALREQRQAYDKRKAYVTLTEILIERGVLTESRMKEILAPMMGIDAENLHNEIDIPANQLKNPSECRLPRELSEGALSDRENADGSKKSAEIIVTKDGLSAYISVNGNESDSPSIEEIHQLLRCRGIIFGIIDDQEIGNQIRAALREKFSFQIAVGIEPENGEPDRVTYHFDTNPFRVGTLNEDGLMDWKDRGEYPHVEKDAVLATITPGKKSVPGKNIFGHVLVAEEVPRLYLFAGKGVGKSKDRLQLIAKTGGQPQLTGRGNVSVIQTLDIKSDIGIETGHVDFEGHIEVRGAVEKGYRVKAESLRAREILSDAVEIAGDVISIRGIFGAKIRCGGRVKANHVNKSTIIAEGDIVVAKEVVDCKIITNGKFILEGGTILSSEIYAKKGIKASAVGSEVSAPNKLVVGVDRIAQIKVDEFKQEISEIKDKIASMEKEIGVLNQESDRLNTELGQIAQVQDQCMVNQRKISDLLKKEKRQPTPEEKEAVSNFKAKIAEIDKTVEELMAQDEKAKAQILTHRNEIFGLDERIKILSEEIKDTELFAKRDMGIPTIQVNGKLFQNTQIEGPHDSLVIEKTISNATIKEQKNTEKDAEKPFSFKLSHR